MSNAAPKRRDFTLLIALLLALLVIAVGGSLLSWALSCASDEAIAAGLTNVAQVGGIVSGLSLSGASVLALSGRYSEKVLSRFGGIVRFVLFGGFSLVVSASLLCALAVVWADTAWVRFVLGYATALILVTLVTTALLVSSAFSWRDDDKNHPARRRTIVNVPAAPPAPHGTTSP